MAPLTVGTQTYASAKELEQAARVFMAQHLAKHGNYSNIHVDPSVVDGWLRPLLEGHPRAEEKMRDWSGGVLVQKFMTGPCLFLLKNDGSKDDISVKACAAGKETAKRTSKKPERWVPPGQQRLTDEMLDALWK